MLRVDRDGWPIGRRFRSDGQETVYSIKEICRCVDFSLGFAVVTVALFAALLVSTGLAQQGAVSEVLKTVRGWAARAASIRFMRTWRGAGYILRAPDLLRA